jgi:predicted ATPase
MTAGSAEGVKQHTDRLVSLADEHGFPYLWAIGLLDGGWAAIALGDPNKGLSLIEKGLATNRAIGSAWGTAWYLIWQADARSKLGQHDLALKLRAEAEALIAKTGERFMEPELFLLRGVLASNAGDGVAAEKNYLQALDVSKRQSARVYQLRAAIAMARLWRDQGKRDEARALLAPVYGWFTEGFDTHDLKEAKALLDELFVAEEVPADSDTYQAVTCILCQRIHFVNPALQQKRAAQVRKEYEALPA